MRKWLTVTSTLVCIYCLSRLGRKKQNFSPFFKNLKDTISIIAWALLTVYIVVFFSWLYNQIFR